VGIRGIEGEAMSEDVVKTAIRVPLKDLEGMGWNNAYEYLAERLGEPEEKDEFEGLVEWFKYKDYDVVSVGDDWFLDMLTEPVSPPYEHSGLRISIKEIYVKLQKLLGKIKVDSIDCQVVAYTWYNGSDEPVL
jgi:hypothetical protein